METTSTSAKKTWEKPSIQTLDINKDTYTQKNAATFESAKTPITNLFREIPS